jgi:hypothetical protein
VDLAPRVSWNAAGATITLNLESDGFTAPGGGAGTQMVFSGVYAVTISGGTATLQAWLNTSNLTPSYGPDQASPGAIAPYPVSNALAGNNALFSGSGSVANPPSGTGSNSLLVTKTGTSYSLFEQIVITTTGAGQLTGDFSASVDAVPAPGGLVLAASGLSSLGLAWLRRRSQKAAIPVG